MSSSIATLLVGELIVDFTLAREGSACKMRLGGVAHAARGLWAAGQRYAVAAFCPAYLVDEAKLYLENIGCEEFIWLGETLGAPSVILIGDATEVSNQGYEDLMRESKLIRYHDPLPNLGNYHSVVVFPGSFCLDTLLDCFSADASFFFDVAYGVGNLSSLVKYKGRIRAIIISTSSDLFTETGTYDIQGLLSEVSKISPEVFLLKENRGGSRLFDLHAGGVEEIPATLGTTVNSVGVGDVYTGVMASLYHLGSIEAAWRGCQAATVYSQSTFPDDIKRDVQRNLRLPFEVVRSIGGTSLPWHDRQRYSIYLAAPDFSYVDRSLIIQALDSLGYHNFKVRRPVAENGELSLPATEADLRRTYRLDCDLIRECDLVFAIPLYRDPGTLVEIGMAIEMGKPVVTYDPRSENANTMVMAGSLIYSNKLDECLSGIFKSIAELRSSQA